ncbi:MAG: COG4223 family protein [Actinomycetota bacterium]
MTSEPTPEAVPAEPAPEVPPSGEPATRSSWTGLVVLAGLLLALVAAAITFPRWSPLLDLGSLSDRSAETAPAPTPAPVGAPAAELAQLRAELDATRERLSALETRVARLPEAPPQPAGPATAQTPARLGEEVDALGRQLAELRRTAADSGAVLRLADRVEQVDAQLRELAGRRSSGAALLLAAAQLREAIDRGMPFDAELRALKALAPQDEEIAKAAEALKARAAAGIPTRSVLEHRFDALAPQIVRAEVLPAADGWWRQTANRLLSLVVIRREDGSEAGDGAAAVVARASARLGQDDLAGAARELGRLTGAPAETAGPWMADALARVGADRSTSELTAHAVALTGAGK